MKFGYPLGCVPITHLKNYPLAHTFIRICPEAIISSKSGSSFCSWSSSSSSWSSSLSSSSSSYSSSSPPSSSCSSSGSLPPVAPSSSSAAWTSAATTSWASSSMLPPSSPAPVLSSSSLASANTFNCYPLGHYPLVIQKIHSLDHPKTHLHLSKYCTGLNISQFFSIWVHWVHSTVLEALPYCLCTEAFFNSWDQHSKELLLSHPVST